MEYLHVLPVKTGEITEFLSMMEENFDLSEHKFLTLITREGIIKGCPELLAFPFVENFETSKSRRMKHLHNYLMLKQRLKQADVIIWHSLSMDKGRFAKILFFNHDLCKKSVWIENGFDAEYWVVYKGKLKNKVSETVQKTIRERITRIGTCFRGNEEYIKNIWPDKQVMLTPYPLNEELSRLLEKMNPESRREKIDKHIAWLHEGEKTTLPRSLRINIQVGQNSQSLNRHNKLIDSLIKYSDSMVNVFFPFCYMLEKNAMNIGTKEYQTRIRKRAISRFHDKCFILSRRVGKETFFRYLKSIDIILLGSENAFEITYLLLAIASGAKLFLDQDSSLYRYLKSAGMKIHKLQDIAEMEYEDFIAWEEPQPLPKEIIQYFDREYVISCWKEFFESIRTE